MSYRKVISDAVLTGSLTADDLAATDDITAGDDVTITDLLTAQRIVSNTTSNAVTFHGTNVNATTNVHGGNVVVGTALYTPVANVATTAVYGITQSITANADANQANATAITTPFSMIATAGVAGAGVILPATPVVGAIYEIFNGGANDVGVYAGTGDQIDSITANSPYYLHPQCTQRFQALSTSAWRTLGRGMRYITRGDPAAADFTQASLTMDNAFYDMDISSIIPLSARGKPVLLRLRLTDASACTLTIKTKGQTNNQNIAYAEVEAGGVDTADGQVFTDSSGILSYRVSTGADGIAVTVKGWWVETA